jgi:hypothetical protein
MHPAQLSLVLVQSFSHYEAITAEEATVTARASSEVSDGTSVVCELREERGEVTADSVNPYIKQSSCEIHGARRVRYL